MKEIWKFPVDGPLPIRVEGARPTRVLSAGLTNGVPVIWVEVLPGAWSGAINVVRSLTGFPLPADLPPFIGTVVDDDGFVVHIFAEVS